MLRHRSVGLGRRARLIAKTMERFPPAVIGRDETKKPRPSNGRDFGLNVFAADYFFFLLSAGSSLDSSGGAVVSS